MGRKEKKKIGKRTVEVHKMEGLYPYVRLEDFMKVCKELEEENKKLKEDVERLIKLSEHKTTTIMGLGKNLDEVKEENKKLREELSAYDREYFDEDKKAENIFMEEDTLQELRDIGEI